MLSNGGTCTVETACPYPIYILESGRLLGPWQRYTMGNKRTSAIVVV